jgi:hypothetical protein
MNERSFERLFAERMEAERGSTRLPDAFYDGFRQRARAVRQRPRWLALIKEPPMRTDSQLGVGSPTVRIAAVMAATVLLAMALVGGGIAGSRLLGADGIVVDASGNGTVTTITEAVAMAQDGDEILVRPGTYRESIVIDKDITLRGEDRDSVIIDPPDDSPVYDDVWWGRSPYSILLIDNAAEVSELTISFSTPAGVDDPSDDHYFVVRGGAPLIHDISMSGGGLYLHAGSAATVRDSDLEGTWVFLEERSPATIEDSSFAAVVANSTNTPTSGGPSTIRNNRTHGILINGPALVEGNEVFAHEVPLWSDGQYGSGIDVQGGEGWIIRANTVTGFLDDTAIVASRTSSGEIVDNVVVDSRTGIHLGAGSHVVEGNEVSGGDTGIVTSLGSSSLLAGNSVTGAAGRGLVLLGSPILRGNHSCGNGENLWIAEGSTPDIDDSNEICPDPAIDDPAGTTR